MALYAVKEHYSCVQSICKFPKHLLVFHFCGRVAPCFDNMRGFGAIERRFVLDSSLAREKLSVSVVC